MKTIILVLLGIVAIAVAYQSGSLAGPVTAAFATAIKPIAVPMVLAINDPAFVYLAAAAILLAGFASCLWYWRSVVAPRQRVVRATAAELRDFSALLDAGMRTPVEIWGQLDDIVPRNGFFAASWGLYAADRFAREGAARPPLPYSWYVAQDPAADAGRRYGFMASLPGYFTTVGLILTFVGLVVALYFAARGFRSGNMEEARAAIVQLLNASAFKFLTSVAALMSALLISVFKRYADSRVAGSVAEASMLIDQLAARMRSAPPGQSGAERMLEALATQIDRLCATLEARPEIRQAAPAAH